MICCCSMPQIFVNGHFQYYWAENLNFGLYPWASPLFTYFTLDINKTNNIC